MSRIYSTIAGFIIDQDGATFTEYCLMLILILLVGFGLVQVIGGITLGMFSVSGTV
jgi:Flp pilus assembly pilin Flp